ncbi:MAG: hypothetical protein HYZ17_04205 [Betaproteobacteria bacterium]|nr:hypothetical protein [Betaproteobacteria bacterium]
MGFWHTGYLEFHDNAGLDFAYRPQRLIYHCQHCGQHFDSMDDLRRHRFQSHPYTCPLLFVRGIELGATPFRVTRSAQPSDFVVELCTIATFNGTPREPREIPKLLAEVSHDKVKVELGNDGPPAVFELVFQIADEMHLKGVEASFLQFANRKLLTVRALEVFIQECRAFNTADAYWGGICDYLYGVLAKERAPDSSLPYDEYRERFNRAADALLDYDRSLAHLVRSLVAFHFNHFEDAALFAPPGQLHMASMRFEAVLKGISWDEAGTPARKPSNAPEDMLTDHETLRILRWTQLPLTELAAEAENIAALVKCDVPEFDRLKLNVLLAEAYAASRDAVHARKTARELIGNAKTAGWAERLIARLAGEEQNT